MRGVFKYGDKQEMKWYKSASRYNNGGIFYREGRVILKARFKIRLVLHLDEILERYS